MQFTQSSLGKLVSQVFFGRDSDPAVVPIQGNFANPQDRPWLTRDMLAGGSDKPQTWIGFEKQDSSPRTYPFIVDNRQQFADAFSLTHKLSRCRLQIVGRQSEEWAETVAHWNLREDVSRILTEFDAILMADGLGRVETSVYDQDGLNIIWAYNVYFSVLWGSSIDLAEGTLWKTADISGTAEVS